MFWVFADYFDSRECKCHAQSWQDAEKVIHNKSVIKLEWQRHINYRKGRVINRERGAYLPHEAIKKELYPKHNVGLAWQDRDIHAKSWSLLWVTFGNTKFQVVKATAVKRGTRFVMLVGGFQKQAEIITS